MDSAQEAVAIIYYSKAQYAELFLLVNWKMSAGGKIQEH
jgi:hypothetical protein